MNKRTETVISILAALLVLFSAMIEPRATLWLAVIFLVAIVIYTFMRTRTRKTDRHRLTRL